MFSRCQQTEVRGSRSNATDRPGWNGVVVVDRSRSTGLGFSCRRRLLTFSSEKPWTLLELQWGFLSDSETPAYHIWTFHSTYWDQTSVCRTRMKIGLDSENGKTACLSAESTSIGSKHSCGQAGGCTVGRSRLDNFVSSSGTHDGLLQYSQNRMKWLGTVHQFGSKCT